MDKKADIIIISDIHIGSEISRARELVRLLRSISFRRLILNGDVFDNENPQRLKKSDWEFLSFLQDLIHKGVDVIWIQGNHDVFSRSFFQMIGIQARREFRFLFNGKKCIVLHGHQYDRFLIKNIIVSVAMNASYRTFQKIDRGKRRTSRFMKRQYKFWLRLSPRVMKGAIKHALERKAQIVICGHTHQQMDKMMNGVRYINTGSWTDSPASYVIFGKDGIKIELIK